MLLSISHHRSRRRAWAHARSLAIALGIAGAIGPGAARADLNSGLIAFYPFDGDAQDASGNGNHGTANATMVLTTDRFGAANSAYQFNGTNSYITVPNSASLSSPTTAITQATWILMYGVSHSGSAFNPITMKSATGENAMMYRFYCYPNGLGVSYGNWNNGRLSAPALPLNTWCFVASTYDGAKIRQYVNGSAVDSVAFSYTMVADTRPLLIGADTPGFFEVFNGKIDDLRIYDRALSGGEIAELAAMTVGVESAVTARPLALAAPRPNPSSAGCTVELSLPAPSDIVVAVYDVAGRRVRTLAHERYRAGVHPIAWDGRDEGGAVTPAGLYWVRAQVGGQERWSRVVRVR